MSRLTAIADALQRASITRETFAYNAKVDVNPQPMLPVLTRGKRFKIIPAVTSVPQEEWSPEFADGRFNHIMGKPSSIKREAIASSRFVQGYEAQSKTYEKHVQMMKPIHHRYPPAIPAHDRALDWHPDHHRDKVDVNLRAKLRADAELRARLQQLANDGEFDDEV